MMNKREEIIVPKGVRYIGQWKNFKLPDFPHIMDKQIPGCGFTQWCLTNEEDIILCSPRKILLKNKWDQFKDDVYYFQNTYEEEKTSPDKDISGTGNLKPLKKKVILQKETSKEEEVAKNKYYSQKQEEILRYILNRKSLQKPFKILVTYDSFHLIRSIVDNISEVFSYRVIIDEFQSIFIDSKFKSGTEMKFVDCLDGINKLCFVSATPMIEDYLRLIDIFQDIPYYELNWEKDQPGRVMKPGLSVRISTSVYGSAKRIIEPYKQGKFEYKFVQDKDGNVNKVESKEAVIYVNSVNNILSIIKKFELTPEECNILCADTSDNRSRIKRKLNSKYKIGTVPLKGEPHKMFTFCTRTVYLGADFCSTNARTFIISDANMDSLAVDISLDLPQILGRQRLDINPWKNEAEFYYKPLTENKELDKKKFDAEVSKKYEKTLNLLNVYNRVSDEKESTALAEKYLSDLISSNYREDYLAVNYKNGKLYPELNKLVMIAEQRAFDIQQIDYADRFSVFNSIGYIVNNELSDEIKKFINEYESQETLYDKLKLLCSRDFHGEKLDSILANISENHFVEYYTILGPERIKALGYNITKLNKELGIISFDKDRLDVLVSKAFNIGDRLSLSNIKIRLKEIYSNCGFNKTAKANDLEIWFEVKEIFVTDHLDDGSKKRGKGYEILSKKQ